MPLTALTDTQKIFLDNYIRKHPIKGRKTRERAEGFSDLRQSVVDLLPNVPATGDGARFARRLENLDLKAAEGDFKAAREAARALLGEMRTFGATYAPDEDIAKLQTMVRAFVADASEAQALNDTYRTGVQTLLARCAPIAPTDMPRGTRGSPGWLAVATPLFNRRAPDVTAVEQGLVERRAELRKIGYFLGMAYEGAVSGLNKQTSLAAEIVKGAGTQEVRDLVSSQLGRVRAPAFAPLCVAGQPGTFLDEDVLLAREENVLRDLAARARALKDQVSSLKAQAGFADAPPDVPVGLDVGQQVKLREDPPDPNAGMGGHRRPRDQGAAAADRLAQSRALMARMGERLRLMKKRGANTAALQAEQDADRLVLAGLGPRPGDLSQKAPPPAEFDVAALASSLPAPTGDTLPGGSPNTDYMPDDREVQQLAAQASDALLLHLATTVTDFTGDEFFDLSLQSAKDFTDQYVQARGWKGPQLTPGRLKVAKAVGKSVYDRVLKFNAEKVSDDNRPVGNGIDLKKGVVQIDGKAYGGPKELARGGFGVVSRYESLDEPGVFVVVKSTIRGEGPPPDAGQAELEDHEEEVAAGRDAMKREVKAHRHLMKAAGASDAPGRANVVGMKGAMAAEDGSLHMVLEMVEGGDLDDNRMAMMVAVNSGALPEEARNILNQARLKQAVQGMMFMRDQDMVHFDIKGANFMVGADGSIKVGDFGSAGVSTSGDGKVVATLNNPGTQGYLPGQAADGQTVDNAYDTFALGKVMQVAHLNVTNPGQANFKTDLPPEFEKLTGALARITNAMTSADAQDRPQLEEVLESSYLKNLDGFDPALIDELSKTAVKYAGALKREAATVRSLVPLADRKEWADGKDPDGLSFTDLTGAMQVVIGKAEAASVQLRTKLEALGPAPVVPQGPVPGKQRLQAAFDKHQAAAQQLQAGIDAQQKIIKDKQALLAGFGKSDEAKQLAAQMRDISNRMLRPSADGAQDTADVDPATVDLQKEFAAAFKDAGVDPVAIGQIDPKFAKKYRLLLNVVGMLRPGANSSRRATILEQVGDLVADLLKKVRDMLAPDETLTEDQAKARRSDASYVGLSKLTASLGSFAGTVTSVAKPRSGAAPPDLAQAKLLDQYIASLAGLGVPIERVNKRLLAFLDAADKAKVQPARATALQSAAGQIEHDLSILEGLRDRVKAVNSAEHATRKTEEQYREKVQTAKRYREALTGLQQLLKSLDSPDEGIDFLGPLSEIVRTTQVTLDDNLIRLLMKADDADLAVRVATRREARTLVSKEGNRLIAWVKELAAEAGELRKPESIAQLKKDIDGALADKKLDVSKVGTEMRKWKAQLEQAAAQA